MALKYPDRLESNNPAAYGIIRATEAAGHKTVQTLNDLYNISDAILSDSKSNVNDDSIGQEWYVVQENSKYKLIDWENRTNSDGWAKVLTDQDITQMINDHQPEVVTSTNDGIVTSDMFTRLLQQNIYLYSNVNMTIPDYYESLANKLLSWCSENAPIFRTYVANNGSVYRQGIGIVYNNRSGVYKAIICIESSDNDDNYSRAFILRYKHSGSWNFNNYVELGSNDIINIINDLKDSSKNCYDKGAVHSNTLFNLTTNASSEEIKEALVDIKGQHPGKSGLDQCIVGNYSLKEYVMQGKCMVGYSGNGYTITYIGQVNPLSVVYACTITINVEGDDDEAIYSVIADGSKVELVNQISYNMGTFSSFNDVGPMLIAHAKVTNPAYSLYGFKVSYNNTEEGGLCVSIKSGKEVVQTLYWKDRCYRRTFNIDNVENNLAWGDLYNDPLRTNIFLSKSISGTALFNLTTKSSNEDIIKTLSYSDSSNPLTFEELQNCANHGWYIKDSDINAHIDVIFNGQELCFTETGLTANISNGPQVRTVSLKYDFSTSQWSCSSNGTQLSLQYNLATPSTDGLMSSQDKEKLDWLGNNYQFPEKFQASSTNVDLVVSNKSGQSNLTIPIATQDLPGIMSATDKQRLDNLQSDYVFPQQFTYTEDDVNLQTQTSKGQNSITLNSATQSTAGVLSSSDKVKLDTVNSMINHGTSDTTFSLTPNIFHKWGTITSLNLTLSNPVDGQAPNYIFQFTSGNTATVLTLPTTIHWVGDHTINQNTTYQVSILDNLAILIGNNQLDGNLSYRVVQ